ncbi:MAG TPA: hypothetical protein VF843_03555 [Streptosporangiaceae bacterium]
MSQHDDRYASTDLPRTTGEFRAAPDASASTAEFKRFMSEQSEQPRRGGAGAWPEQPQAGEPPQPRGSNRTMLYIAGAIALVVVVAVIIFAVG